MMQDVAIEPGFLSVFSVHVDFRSRNPPTIFLVVHYSKNYASMIYRHQGFSCMVTETEKACRHEATLRDQTSV